MEIANAFGVVAVQADRATASVRGFSASSAEAVAAANDVTKAIGAAGSAAQKGSYLNDPAVKMLQKLAADLNANKEANPTGQGNWIAQLIQQELDQMARYASAGKLDSLTMNQMLYDIRNQLKGLGLDTGITTGMSGTG